MQKTNREKLKKKRKKRGKIEKKNEKKKNKKKGMHCELSTMLLGVGEQ
jgi:hypothetical protein